MALDGVASERQSQRYQTTMQVLTVADQRIGESLRDCVFCGRPPLRKTKEHIIPQWLIGLTGDPKRQVKLGLIKDSTQLIPRTYSFDAFHFPACADCNATSSQLEGLAQRVVAKLLAFEPLAAGDFDVLLDWLDKIRTGLWLAHRALDRSLLGIRPRFRISDRIALHDRMVAIYLTDYDKPGLTFVGTDVPAFGSTPSCFSRGCGDCGAIEVAAPTRGPAGRAHRRRQGWWRNERRELLLEFQLESGRTLALFLEWERIY